MKSLSVALKFLIILVWFQAPAFSSFATIPGPNYIFKCPNCAHLIQRASLMSANTSGAILYSDGKMVAPLIPEIPNLTKCSKCNHFFWLSDLKEIGTCDWRKEESCPNEWVEAEHAPNLHLTDLFLSLKSAAGTSLRNEKAIRIMIWRSYNNRLRAKKELFLDKNDEAIWEQNCTRLIELLDESIATEKLVKAELYRNLGSFDLSIKLLKTADETFKKVSEILIKECENKNTMLVKLKMEE